MRPNYVLVRTTERVSRKRATSGKNESRALISQCVSRILIQNALQLPTSTQASVLSGFFFVECNIFTGSAIISMLTVCCALAERPVLFSPGSEAPQNGTFWMTPLFNTEYFDHLGPTALAVHKLNLHLA